VGETAVVVLSALLQLAVVVFGFFGDAPCKRGGGGGLGFGGSPGRKGTGGAGGAASSASKRGFA
jgi:hypothetical protein